MGTKDLLIMFFGIFFVGLTMFIALDYITTYEHENVHKQINTYFGCDNVTIEMNLWDTSYTKCNDENRSVTQQEWALHAYNEIVSYNNTQINLTIFFCTMLIILFLFMLFIPIIRDKD